MGSVVTGHGLVHQTEAARMYILASFQRWNFIGFLRVGAHEYSAVAYRAL